MKGKMMIILTLMLGLALIVACVPLTPTPTSTVTVPPLNAEFSASATKVKTGEKVKFTDKITGGVQPYTYEWDFDNDGKVDSTMTNPSYSYSKPGSYTVSLKVTDAKGNVNTEIKKAYITVIPVIKGIEPTARYFIELLDKGEFEEAHKFFNKTMAKALPVEKLKEIWEGLTAQVGKLKGIEKTEVTKEMGYDVVYVTCNFAKTSLNVKLVFDTEKKIAGLWFVPIKSKASYNPPEYAEPSSFTEVECFVGTGEWQLPATLTLPKGEGPFPAVVLVHGSGPNDKDETIGPNKPFKDLAWGLATKGIVVLRYEKRTKQYANKILSQLSDFTVNEETVNDALAAIRLLWEKQKIDPERIFLLGHSLGGMLAPRIGAQSKGLAGLILLAANARDLPDLILDQTKYIFSLDGKIDESEAKKLAELEKQVEKVKELEIKEGEVVFGASKAYWADLMAYDPVKEAKKLTIPMLILQGGRDYQVTKEDFKLWQEGLAGQGRVKFKLYPELNHLFIPGEGKSTPSEYMRPGNVAGAVIEDIAKWIKQQAI